MIDKILFKELNCIPSNSSSWTKLFSRSSSSVSSVCTCEIMHQLSRVWLIVLLSHVFNLLKALNDLSLDALAADITILFHKFVLLPRVKLILEVLN